MGEERDLLFEEVEVGKGGGEVLVKEGEVFERG